MERNRENKPVIIYYRNKSKGYTLFMVANRLSDLVRLSGGSYENLTETLLANLKPKKKYNTLEGIQPFALEFNNVNRSFVNRITGYDDIEIMNMADVPMSAEKIQENFEKWISLYTNNQRKIMIKELSRIVIAGIDGDFEEYRSDKLEQELRNVFSDIRQGYKAELSDKVDDLILKLRGSAFGTSMYKSVNDLIGAAKSYDFNKEITDMMIKRVILIREGKIEQADDVLDKVLGKMSELKSKVQ